MASSLVLFISTTVDLPEQHIPSVLATEWGPTLQTLPVPQEFRFLRDLLVLEDPESPLLIDSEKLSAWKQAWSLRWDLSPVPLDNIFRVLGLLLLKRMNFSPI